MGKHKVAHKKIWQLSTAQCDASVTRNPQNTQKFYISLNTYCTNTRIVWVCSNIVAGYNCSCFPPVNPNKCQEQWYGDPQAPVTQVGQENTTQKCWIIKGEPLGMAQKTGCCIIIVNQYNAQSQKQHSIVVQESQLGSPPSSINQQGFPGFGQSLWSVWVMWYQNILGQCPANMVGSSRSISHNLHVRKKVGRGCKLCC